MNSDYSSEPPRRELYRDPSRGKIADYFGLELWVVRIIAVTALIFFQFPVFIAYVVAYFVLEPKPGTAKHERFTPRHSFGKAGRKAEQGEPEMSGATASVQQVWRKGSLPGQKLKQINAEFRHLEQRLRAMETFVTSKQFQLRKEFENL